MRWRRCVRCVARANGHEAAQADVQFQQGLAFEQLLALARSENAGKTHLRKDLFDRLATITAGPKQEVTYHLAAATYLSEAPQPQQVQAAQQAQEAVEHLQAVLADKALTSQLYETPTISRQAGLEARRRLKALIEAHGKSIYAPYERQAAMQLQRLLDRHGNAEALVALAERYPISEAAPEALIHAAGQYAQADEFACAGQQLRRAWDWASTPQLKTRVVSQIAQLYESQGQPRRAMAWLDRLAEAYPDMQPTRQGQSIPVSQWMSRLKAMPAGAGSLPALALPLGQPRLLPGQLVDQPADERAVLLTLDEQGKLCRYEDASLKVRWRTAAPAIGLRLLDANEDQLLLWSPMSHELVAINDATGEVMWQQANVATLLNGAGDVGDRRSLQAANQPGPGNMVVFRGRLVRVQMQQLQQDDGPADDEDQRIFTATGPTTVALADAYGRVVGLDRRTGKVLWQLMAPTERVTQVTSQHDTLVLAGFTGVGSNVRSGSVTVLDMLTGEQRLSPIEDKQVPQWVALAGENLLAVVTDGQVTMYRLSSGEVAWRTQLKGVSRIPEQGWGDEAMLALVISENGGRVMRLYEPTSGQLLGRLQLPATAVTPLIHAQPAEQRWYVETVNGLAAVDSTGHVQWRDAIADADQTIIGHVMTRDYAALLTRADPETPQNEQVIIEGKGGQVQAQARIQVLHSTSAAQGSGGAGRQWRRWRRR